jgi:hypothetical protein
VFGIPARRSIRNFGVEKESTNLKNRLDDILRSISFIPKLRQYICCCANTTFTAPEESLGIAAIGDS